MPGKLYIVATPIGNLGDISIRALDTLKSVSFIAAEDTRVTMKLTNHFSIKAPLVSYYEHNAKEQGEKIVSRILSGEDCALVCDAGTPSISDPGKDLASLCADSGITVVPVPGPSAIITALSASGMNTGRFTFEGFLSTSQKSRKEHLKSLINEERTMVFYEAPHKLNKTLRDFYDTFGNRAICISREITKLHEEFLRTTLSDAISHFEEHPPRGEFVLILSGAEHKKPDTIDALSMVGLYVEKGMSLSESVKKVSRDASVGKSELYRMALEKYKKDPI
ncbi:MAG: 16S rRNA (cytidine(1402)-2'-O)-methyltransferase [Clostridiales bacterium]|nr:16S rRNA (cytidine(1402)-2'-O)-methyltransferase [Clostridiales bacterium]